MFAKEIQSFKSWLECTPVAADRLWARGLEDISELELQLFYARAGLSGNKNIAVTLSSDFVSPAKAAELLSSGKRVRHESSAGLDLHFFEDGSLLVESSSGDYAVVH